MTENQSMQFRNKSISQLVMQLNNLGDDHVAIHPTTLIGVQDRDCHAIRRFRSKSVHKSPTCSTHNNTTDPPNKSEFFLTDGSQKKYYYNEIVQDLETIVIGSILNKFELGFNTTILMEYSQRRYMEVIEKIEPWLQDSDAGSCLAYLLEYKAKEAVDILSGSKPKIIPLNESNDRNHVFYDIGFEDLIKAGKKLKGEHIRILKLMKKSGNPAQVRLIMLPQQFLTANVDDPSLKIVKTQLSQILNYIKTNPNKRYQHINKLLPKRYPTTTAIAQIVLYDSANFILNWVSDGWSINSLTQGRFQFYDRVHHVSNFIKKVPYSKVTNPVTIIKKNPTKKEPKGTQQKLPINQSAGTKLIESNVTKPYNFYEVKPENPNQQGMNELEYCRTFERKTHKYSISGFQQDNNQEDLFPTKNQPSIPECTESEKISLLKAQHARQISQYHQTIQNLNKKILILTSDRGLEQLYTIHEREIMMLELKIEELRKQYISKLSGPNTGKSKDNNQVQNLKSMLKKLNEELLLTHKNSSSYKLAQGKMKMIERELNEFKDKYNRSQVARKQLQLEVEALTNRLKLKDNENEALMAMGNDKYGEDQVAAQDLATMKEVEVMLDSMESGNKDSHKYIMRKVKNILRDLSGAREIVLQCNNFLVDLQDHIESRLSEKDPDVVLDCNRFIRSYLLNNLSIF